MKNLILAILVPLIFMSCSTKNIDSETFIKLTKLVDSGKYETALPIFDSLSTIYDDKNLKAAHVRSLVLYGNYLMYESDFPPKVKYPGALKQYKQALQIDPNNTEARENAKLITSIYSQMGREIPEQN
ncbi:MAG: tetratricopeptide repeat protein [Bacteroidetes bacterium]|nr:tetratricopeptide repeat protein [Bacteroidota bacterium]